MKPHQFLYATALLTAFTFSSCNNRNNAGNTTDEGTTLVDQRPNQNQATMSGDTDTLTSPGSNAEDIKNGNVGNDANMQNQSNTHGSDTQRGDNGTGSAGGTGSTAGTSGTGSGSVGSGSGR